MHCSVLHLMHNTSHHCTALHYSALNFTALCCASMQSIALYWVVLHCTGLICIAIHCIALLYTAFHCTVLHCTALHLTVTVLCLRACITIRDTWINVRANPLAMWRWGQGRKTVCLTLKSMGLTSDMQNVTFFKQVYVQTNIFLWKNTKITVEHKVRIHFSKYSLSPTHFDWMYY